jgi:hypothetical protein
MKASHIMTDSVSEKNDAALSENAMALAAQEFEPLEGEFDAEGFSGDDGERSR